MNRIKFVSILLACMCLSSCGLRRSETGADVTQTSPSGGAGSKVTSADTDGGEETPKDKTVRLSFACAGDNIIHESIYTEAAAKASSMASAGGYTGNYYFDSMYTANVEALVGTADIAFVNQEAPITGLKASGYPNFNSPPEAGDALVSMGFDIVNIANNHMLDMENLTEGYRKTIEYWKTKDVLQIGGYENDADYEKLRFYEKDGVKIAMLSFTYGTNGYRVNSASPCVVPLIDDSVIRERIARARGEADLVFVSMHWGDENTQAPNAEQKRLAKLIADCGADAVIGHHSHTVQPSDWVTGESGKKTLVIYSLGNFISTQLKAVNMVGNIVTFDIVKEENMPAYLTNIVSNPTVTHYVADETVHDSQDLPVRSGVEVYLMEDYTQALCSAHGAQLYGSFTLDTLKKYITDVIPDEFLPAYLKTSK